MSDPMLSRERLTGESFTNGTIKVLKRIQISRTRIFVLGEVRGRLSLITAALDGHGDVCRVLGYTYMVTAVALDLAAALESVAA